MPTYEYRCTSCGHQFEKFQKFTDEPIKICPVCGQVVRKVFHPAGVVFKGSGWYINDSRKSENKSNSPANTEKTVTEKEKVESPTAEASKPESTASDNGKTETKTEKTETKKTDSSAAPAA